MKQETQIMVKMSNEEKDIIKKASKLKGLGCSSYVRSVAIKDARETLLNLS